MWTDFTNTNLPKELPKVDGRITFICCQQEICPETERLHLQGYVQLSKPTTIVWLRREWRQCNYDACKGTAVQCTDYCTKEESRVEGSEPVVFGTFKFQGYRSDIVRFRDKIQRGKRDLRDMLQEEVKTVAKYPRLFYTISQFERPDPRLEGVILVCGPTGVGKTYAWNDTNYYSGFEVNEASGDKVWFDGYDMHENVLFDEFCGARSKWSLSKFLRYTANYAQRCEVKGGFMWWSPKEITVTTNLHPLVWWDYSNRRANWSALVNRFTKVVLMWSREEEDIVIEAKDEMKLFFETFIDFDNRNSRGALRPAYIPTPTGSLFDDERQRTSLEEQ